MNLIFDPSLVLYLPLHEMGGSSLMSQDACGHSCTITGALWRPSGCYFDGTDDYISCGTIAIPASPTTYCAWLKDNDNVVGEVRRIFNVVEGANYRNLSRTDTGKLTVYDGTNVVTATKSIKNDGLWHYVCVVYQTNDIKFFIDGESDVISAGSTFVLNAMSAAVSVSAAGAASWKGMMGEVMIYNRALLPVEIQHNYLATKWRYQ